MLEQEFGYKPPIPDDQRKEYENALMRVERWKGGHWRKDLSENDWDHVRGMFRLLSDINNSCPTLSSEVNMEDVQHMIYIHDAGEIIVGDLTHDRDDYDALYPRWKSREHAAVRLMTRRIEEKEVMFKARSLYKRYATKKPDDKEALLTDFIDKLQGLRFGFENAFNGRGMRKGNREMQFNHAFGLIIHPIKPLIQLVTPTSQSALRTFLRTELKSLSKFGYKREYASYVKNLDATLR